MQKLHIVVSAIVGANLLAFAYHANSVQSLDCFQSFLPQPKDERPRIGSIDTPLDQRGRKEGYYDVRLKKDVTFPVQPEPHAAVPAMLSPAAAAPAPQADPPPLVAPSATRRVSDVPSMETPLMRWEREHGRAWQAGDER